MDQLELQLGHLCNNRCVFCVSGQLSELGIARQVPPEPVLAALDDAAARGIRKVTFLGGEPTSQKSFLPALQRAVDLGFSEIVIFTNGVTSANRAFIERIIAIGSFTWRFSIQGGTEEAHDAVTQVPGSFRRIVDGLTSLKALGQRVTANMCANELSYRSLPHYPDLVREFGIRDLHIDMVRPENAGPRTDEYLQSILPRFSEMVPYIGQMLEEFERFDPEYDVNIGNLPFCLLPEWSHKIHHGGQQTTIITRDGSGEMRTIDDKYAKQWSDMIHGPQCDACALRSDCRGVPSKYAQFYGFEELRPLSAQALLRVSRDGRVFVRVIDELLSGVYRSEPPKPWVRAGIALRSREGFIEMSYVAGEGDGARRATFVVARPGRDYGRQLWETRHYCVSLPEEAGSPHLPSLLRWLHAALRIPVQSRIAACVERVRDAKLTAGWRYESCEADVDSLGVTAFLRSDDGRIGVRLTPQNDSRVDVSFDLDEVEPLHARPIVEQVTAALR